MAALLTGYAESAITTGKFVRRRLSDGAFWSTVAIAFETYSSGNIANYGIAATEITSSGMYTVTDPAPGTPGDYLFVKATGASLAVADLTTGIRWQDSTGNTSLADVQARLPTTLDANGFMKADVEDWKAATAPAMTGDAFARLGVNGAGLSVLGDARLANLDALISSRMAIYTQPAGFLATTFPGGTVASTTNITAGTIANLTNLPPITTNWLTASGVAAGALNGKGDWLLSSSYVVPDNTDIATALTDVVVLLSRVTVSPATNVDMQTALGSLTTLLNRVTAAVALAGTAPSWYTSPIDVSANVLAIKGKTDNLPVHPAASGDSGGVFM